MAADLWVGIIDPQDRVGDVVHGNPVATLEETTRARERLVDRVGVGLGNEIEEVAACRLG